MELIAPLVLRTEPQSSLSLGHSASVTAMEEAMTKGDKVIIDGQECTVVWSSDEMTVAALVGRFK